MPLVANRKGRKVAGKSNAFQGMFLSMAKDALLKFAEKESICFLYDDEEDSTVLPRFVSGMEIIDALPPLYYSVISDLMTVPDTWNDTQYSKWSEERYQIKFHTVRRKRAVSLMALAYIPNGLKISMADNVRLKKEAEALCTYLRDKLLGKEAYWYVDEKGIGHLTRTKPEEDMGYAVLDVPMESTQREDETEQVKGTTEVVSLDYSFVQYLNDLDFWDSYVIGEAEKFYRARRDEEISFIDKEINLLHEFERYRDILSKFEEGNLIITEVPDVSDRLARLENRRRVWEDDLSQHFNVVKRHVDSVNIVRWAMQELKKSWSDADKHVEDEATEA